MAKHKAKKYHAVVRGHIPGLITESWAVADALTNGYHGKKHKGFQTLEDAKDYMKENGYPDCEIILGIAQVIGSKIGKSCSVYAVAHGSKKGVYISYYDGAEPQVNKQPRSCHKKFYSLEEADAFIHEYETCKDALRKIKSGDDLSDLMGKLQVSCD